MNFAIKHFDILKELELHFFEACVQMYEGHLGTFKNFVVNKNVKLIMLYLFVFYQNVLYFPKYKISSSNN